jgi:hypothetical protein
MFGVKAVLVPMRTFITFKWKNILYYLSTDKNHRLFSQSIHIIESRADINTGSWNSIAETSLKDPSYTIL